MYALRRRDTRIFSGVRGGSRSRGLRGGVPGVGFVRLVRTDVVTLPPVHCVCRRRGIDFFSRAQGASWSEACLMGRGQETPRGSAGSWFPGLLCPLALGVHVVKVALVEAASQRAVVAHTADRNVPYVCDLAYIFPLAE